MSSAHGLIMCDHLWSLQASEWLKRPKKRLKTRIMVLMFYKTLNDYFGILKTLVAMWWWHTASVDLQRVWFQSLVRWNCEYGPCWRNIEFPKEIGRLPNQIWFAVRMLTKSDIDAKAKMSGRRYCNCPFDLLCNMADGQQVPLTRGNVAHHLLTSFLLGKSKKKESKRDLHIANHIGIWLLVKGFVSNPTARPRDRRKRRAEKAAKS